jgi:hypothetical protein
MTERHLDDAIDRAAREMMAVDTDGAFRARLFARLDGARRRPALFTWTRLAVAGAAAAALALAVVLPHRQSAPAPLSAIPSTAAVEIPAPVDARPARGVQERRGAGARGTTPRTAPSRASREPAPATPAGSGNVTQQLGAGTITATVFEDAAAPAGHSVGPIEPITLEPLQSELIAPPAIVIPPLGQIRQVQIAPLFQSVERN